MFVEFVAHLLVSAALLLLVASLVRGVQVAGWGAAFLGAIVLGLVNAFVRPIMVLLTLPLTVLTFGLFLLVINAFTLWLMAALVPGVQVKGFGPALLDMASINREQRQFQPALTYLERYHKIFPQSPESLWLSAGVYRDLGNSDLATTYEERLNTLFPQSAQARRLRESSSQ